MKGQKRKLSYYFSLIVLFEFIVAPFIGLSSAIVNADNVSSSNSSELKQINFTVSKKWTDTNHPESVTVELLANGKEIQSETLSADNNWTYTWENLSNKDSDGNEISYSVKEENIPGYQVSYSDVQTSSGGSTAVWLPADHWESGHQYIMTTSPNTGTVNALQDCGKIGNGMGILLMYQDQVANSHILAILQMKKRKKIMVHLFGHLNYMRLESKLIT